MPNLINLIAFILRGIISIYDFTIGWYWCSAILAFLSLTNLYLFIK